MTTEYLTLDQHPENLSSLSIFDSLRIFWAPLYYGTLKINTDAAFLEGTIGLGILIRNHLGIPVLAKAIPWSVIFFWILENFWVSLKVIFRAYLTHQGF